MRSFSFSRATLIARAVAPLKTARGFSTAMHQCIGSNHLAGEHRDI